MDGSLSVSSCRAAAPSGRIAATRPRFLIVSLLGCLEFALSNLRCLEFALSRLRGLEIALLFMPPEIFDLPRSKFLQANLGKAAKSDGHRRTSGLPIQMRPSRKTAPPKHRFGTDLPQGQKLECLRQAEYLLVRRVRSSPAPRKTSTGASHKDFHKRGSRLSR